MFLKEILRIVIGVLTVNQYTFVVFLKTKVSERLFLLGVYVKI